jgi:hypothetical protein
MNKHSLTRYSLNSRMGLSFDSEGEWCEYEDAEEMIAAISAERAQLQVQLNLTQADRARLKEAVDDMSIMWKDDVDQLQSELDKLQDPSAVWANILRGAIARPSALDHYEECKAAVERLHAMNAKLVNALEECKSAGYKWQSDKIASNAIATTKGDQ